MSEEIKEIPTTENETQISLEDMVYDLQETIESMLLAGCGGCGWEGPFWRVQPGNKCPNCGHQDIISAFEANEIERQELEEESGKP